MSDSIAVDLALLASDGHDLRPSVVEERARRAREAIE